MTDPTTQQTAGPVIAPPAQIVPPTFESVSAKAHDLLLEIDNSQAHTEISQFIIAGRAQVVAAVAFVEAHFHAFEVKAAAAVKAVEATVSAIATAAPVDPTAQSAAPAAAAAPASAVPTDPTAAPATQAAQ